MDAMEEKCHKNMLEELISIKRHEAPSHLPPLIKATGCLQNSTPALNQSQSYSNLELKMFWCWR